MGLLVVAGASGALGRAVVREALGRGVAVRAFVRNPDHLPPGLRAAVDVAVGDARDPAAAAAAVRGAELVFSCAGASVLPALGRGWRGYAAVDTRANAALIDAAVAAGARRFAYVSVCHPPAMRRLAYVDAHERVVARLQASRLEHAIVRPTGFFSAIGAYVDLARRGAVPELGDGHTRSNPIADEDLAAVCVDALLDPAPRVELDAGGPDTLSRHELAELAFAALHAAPRVRHIPAWLARAGAAALRPFHPRLAQLGAFVAALAAHDVIAPVRGRRHLADHLARVAGAQPTSRPAHAV